MYKVESNYCSCHSETCCCNPWIIVNDEGEKITSFFKKEKADKVTNRLNMAEAIIGEVDLSDLEKLLEDKRKEKFLEFKIPLSEVDNVVSMYWRMLVLLEGGIDPEKDILDKQLVSGAYTILNRCGISNARPRFEKNTNA